MRAPPLCISQTQVLWPWHAPWQTSWHGHLAVRRNVDLCAHCLIYLQCHQHQKPQTQLYKAKLQLLKEHVT